MDYRETGFMRLEGFVSALRSIADECEGYIRDGRQREGTGWLHDTIERVLHTFFWGSANAYMHISDSLSNLRTQQIIELVAKPPFREEKP